MSGSQSSWSRLSALLYGGVCYALFLGVFVYLVLFTGDLLVPKGVNDGPALPLWQALLVDTGLLLLFGVQHSVMARGWFKRWWTRVVPAVVERSTYVLIASLCLVALMALWAPLPGTVWHATGAGAQTVLWGLFVAGWGLVLLSTFLIDHFELFGLRQVWAHFRGTTASSPDFKTPSLYRAVRHPMMLGFLLALWGAPHMTGSRLVLAVGLSAYILVGIYCEERAMLRRFGAPYAEYRRTVPMLIPGIRLGGRGKRPGDRSDAVG